MKKSAKRGRPKKRARTVKTQIALAPATLRWLRTQAGGPKKIGRFLDSIAAQETAPAAIRARVHSLPLANMGGPA